MNDRLLVAGLCGFLVSLILTPLVRQIARRKALLDQPNHRSSHAVAVPRVGGAAIVPATIVSAFITIQYIDWRLVALGVASLILAGTGFVDDMKPMTPAQKYSPQVVASILAVLALKPVLVVPLPFTSVTLSGLSAMVLGAFWIMAFINALNFMDGINGLAAGVGALISIGVLMLTSGAGAFMLLPLAAALMGFLAWNTDPASIFMGDGGSQFVGFVLAIGALHWPSERVNAVAVLFMFAPLLFDTGFTLVRRTLLRQNIFRAHRTHLYQRLTDLGYSHRAVANLYYCAVALSMLGAAAYMSGGSAVRMTLIVSAVVVASSYVIVVGMLERGALRTPLLMPSSSAARIHDMPIRMHSTEVDKTSMIEKVSL